MNPPRHFIFPTKAAHFVERSDVIEKLKREMNTSSQTVVIYGIPRQGKSQVALDFCYQSRGEKRFDFIA